MTQIITVGEKIKTQLRPFLENAEVQHRIGQALAKKMDPTYFASAIESVARRNPDVLECHELSVLGSIVSCAQIGLDPQPALRHVAFIPRRNRHLGGKKELCMQIMYPGYIELARRSGVVEKVDCGTHYPDDIFEHEEGTNEYLKHIRKNPKRNAENYIGAWSVLWIASVVPGNNPLKKICYLTRDQIEHAASRSKSDNVWKTDPDSMREKTAIRKNLMRVSFSGEAGRSMSRAIDLEERQILRADELDKPGGDPDKFPHPAEEVGLTEGEIQIDTDEFERIQKEMDEEGTSFGKEAE